MLRSYGLGTGLLREIPSYNVTELQMSQELTKRIVEVWLETIEPNKRFHYKEAMNGEVSPEAYGHLRKIFHDLVIDRKAKSSGYRDGYYERLEQIEPIRSFSPNEDQFYDLVFPLGHGGDGSEFGFENYMDISPGDLIVITGVSNYGKTGLVLNIMGENLDKGVTLMGNEYVTADRIITPKLKRRLLRMNWVEWEDGNGELRFELLPVKHNYEDYIRKDRLNIIDWISMPKDFWGIAQIMDSIKSRIGNGLVVLVLQKVRGRDWGDGGEFSERLSDVYFKIDPFGENESMLTVGKVKEPKGRITGRSWAFSIVDGGANLHNIRELKRCPKCRGAHSSKNCPSCHGKGFVELNSL